MFFFQSMLGLTTGGYGLQNRLFCKKLCFLFIESVLFFLTQQNIVDFDLSVWFEQWSETLSWFSVVL